MAQNSATSSISPTACGHGRVILAVVKKVVCRRHSCILLHGHERNYPRFWIWASESAIFPVTNMANLD